jgi:putative effector of murein hydrolase LrgA (UPF0299 family)
VILRALFTVARVVWTAVVVFLVTLLVLLAIGWFVDVVIDPAEQEITTVEASS